MKVAIAAAALSLVLAFSAGAAEYQSAAATQHYACERGGVSRVALRAPACCAGQLACSQFLSTTTMVRPNASPRT